MKLKDIIGLSLVSLFLFPIVLIGIMLATGVAHIQFGDGKDKERLKETFTASELMLQSQTEEKHLKAFKAAEQKEKEIAERQQELARETERLEALRLEMETAKREIEGERRKIEELVGKHSEVADKQIAALAEVYGGMRPEEAAPILLSLDDAMVVRILRKIPETRATSKLMAALAALDVKRAARLTALLGGKGQTRTRPVRNQPAEPSLPAAPAEKPPAAAPKASGAVKDKPAAAEAGTGNETGKKDDQAGA